MSDEKVDYLEVDEQIPGQNYVCLSFVSPEELIQSKEAFKATKFLQSYCKSEKLKFDDVYSKYQDFTYKYQDELQRDFDEQNKFQTSIRGVKVRGVFDTHAAAQARAKKLSMLDSNFHVFIGQVGYWLPWDPNADKVTDEVFQNSQLNDMMEKYQENNVNRDVFYEEQKRDKIKAAQEEVRKNKEEQEKQRGADKEKTYDLEDTKGETKEDTKIDDMVNTLSKDESSVEGVVEKVVEKVVETIEEGATKVEEVAETVEEVAETVEEVAETVEEGTKIDADLKRSIEDEDPWLKRKNE